MNNLEIGDIQKLHQEKQQQELKEKKIENAKPIADWMDIVTLPTKIVRLSILDLEIRIPEIFLRLIFVSCALGYIDGYFYHNYGHFATMMTGNLIILFSEYHYNQTENFYETFITLIAFVFVGVYIQSYIGLYYKKWNKSYQATLYLFAFGIILEAISVLYFNNYKWVGKIVLIISTSSLCQWSTKAVYLVWIQTGNMMKFIEFTFKLLHGYNLGNSKNIGDVFVWFSIILSFIVGASFAIFISAKIKNLTYLKLLPVIIVTLMLIIEKNLNKKFLNNDSSTTSLISKS